MRVADHLKIEPFLCMTLHRAGQPKNLHAVKVLLFALQSLHPTTVLITGVFQRENIGDVEVIVIDCRIQGVPLSFHGFTIVLTCSLPNLWFFQF